MTLTMRPRHNPLFPQKPAALSAIGWAYLCRGRALSSMRASLLFLSTCVFAISIGAPARVAHGTPADIDVTGNIVGNTIIAGVTFNSDSSTTESRCTWNTTVISDNRNEPYSFIVRNGITYRWYVRTCAPSVSGQPYALSFHWIPIISESTLAEQASAHSWNTLPVPFVNTAPPAQRALVKLPMWWWVTNSSWRTISTTAWIPTPRGIVTVTVTAKPSALLVNPGDATAENKGKFTCSGPGKAWRASDGDDATSNCMYTYAHSSSRKTWNASVSIRWSISWKSNLGKKGTLPSVTTTRRIPVVVGEIQALVTE